MYAALVPDLGPIPDTASIRLTLATQDGALLVGTPTALRNLLGDGVTIVGVPDGLGPWVTAEDIDDRA